MAEKKVIHIANKNSGGLYGTSDTLCSFSSAFLYLPQYMLTTYFFFHQIPVFFSDQDVQRQLSKLSQKTTDLLHFILQPT